VEAPNSSDTSHQPARRLFGAAPRDYESPRTWNSGSSWWMIGAHTKGEQEDRERDGLLDEADIPPLYITQNFQLAQLRFRMHSSPPATIQHFLWQLWQPLLQLVPLNTLETSMQTAICHVDISLVIPWLAYIQYPWPACSAYYRKTRMTVLVIVFYFARS